MKNPVLAYRLRARSQRLRPFPGPVLVGELKVARDLVFVELERARVGPREALEIEFPRETIEAFLFEVLQISHADPRLVGDTPQLNLLGLAECLERLAPIGHLEPPSPPHEESSNRGSQAIQPPPMVQLTCSVITTSR